MQNSKVSFTRPARSPAIDYRRLLILIGGLLYGANQPAPAAADFVPRDVRVSDTGIVDPEFDRDAARFVWSDAKGNVWLGFIDELTGDVLPTSGKGALIGKAALIVGRDVINGPEWVSTAGGSQVVYTSASGDPPVTQLARAYQGRNGWVWGLLPSGADRERPFGSTTLGDPSPRICYRSHQVDAMGAELLLWRELSKPNSETVAPLEGIRGATWVDGARGLVVVAGQERQVFYYDVDVGSVEQLTFDGGDKKVAYMWQAPEFNDEYVLMALIDERELGLYRQTDGVWTRVGTLKPPSSGDLIQSPEYFVYEGRSYVFMVTSAVAQGNKTPTDIWISGIDPDVPFYRQVSDLEERGRTDAEISILDSGPFIYYRGQLAGGGGALFRCDTGLGPQAQFSAP